MKESGIEWIGEIPEEWNVRKMKYCGELDSNGVDKKQRDGEKLFKSVHYMDVYTNSLHEIGNSDDYLIISADDKKAEMCTLKQGDVLLTTSSENPEDIGHSTEISEDLDKTLFGYHLMRFRATMPLALHLRKYLIGSYLMRQWFEYRSVGMTRYGLSRSDIADAKLILPPFAKQQQIASFLDKKSSLIDSTIEKEREIIEKLKEYRQAVITEAVTKGIRAGVPMKDSGVEWIGEIPEGWNFSRVKYEFIILDDKRQPISSEFRGDIEGFYDYYGASGIIDKINDYLFDETLLLIGEDGANLVMRNLPLIYIAKGKYWVNNHAHVLKPKETNNLYYMAYQLESVDLFSFITGSTQPKLTQYKLSIIPVIVPPLSEQQEIADFLDKKCSGIDTTIQKRELAIEKLTAYKQSLIYECVTGKREVLA